ncbi:hypothetical protein C4901_16690 [Acidiferrobacter sp. SPIII_3]|nr:hypothetical protein C4901_16690 [Acidiferrobacter sp. SPIII_3]
MRSARGLAYEAAASGGGGARLADGGAFPLAEGVTAIAQVLVEHRGRVVDGAGAAGASGGAGDDRVCLWPKARAMGAWPRRSLITLETKKSPRWRHMSPASIRAADVSGGRRLGAPIGAAPDPA